MENTSKEFEAVKLKTTASQDSAKGSAGESSFLGIDEIAAIVGLLDSHGVTEFELSRGGETLRLKREIQTSSPAEANAVAVLPNNNTSSAESPVNRVKAVNGADSEGRPEFSSIRSPMVGTFYRRSSPDAEAYVEVGDVVRKGQVLCIVEAMKVMNEIQSDISGKIVEICLSDAQMVEYGETLFRIDPF